MAVLPHGDPGWVRTSASPGKSRELSLELRSREDVVGRDRTCDAPRFRRALYRLSFDHGRWARLDSNQQPLVCKTSALSIELLAREYRGRESNPHGGPHGALDAARLPFRHLDAT
jgi:hypothetical protein